MDRDTMAAMMLAKQMAYPRHAAIIQAATPLSEKILEKSLVSCFEEQAERTPQSLAVVAEEGSLTYEELNETANRLAHHLLAMGLSVTIPTTILLNRSLDTIVCTLAILKTGGYFLCLEPTLPVQRARDLLNRSATRMILTTSAHAAYLNEVAPDGNEWLLLDQVVMEDSTQNLNIPISPAQPSRLGFTSGSTGAPKPGLKDHRNYLYGTWQQSNAYLLSPLDHHAFVYQFSTGVATRAAYNALLTGGSVHLHPGVNYDMSSWADWIEAQEITLINMPTVAFRELLQTRPDGCNFPSVRRISTGGQTVYRQDAELFQRRFCRGTLMGTTYAMTETSSLAHYLIDHDTKFEGETVPLGYALPGRQLLIVDEEGRELGFDQPGEIAVRNLYANIAEASNKGGAPGSDQDNISFFRTSDLGLLRPDGCLIYLGRKDDMVKVRGNRVALSEAENLLLKVNGVAQAAVKPFRTASGDNRLVGYVTSAKEAQITVASVRAEMNRLAPAYMVPARIVLLATMPITASGKIDRPSLPMPDTARPDLETPFVAPRNDMEEQIAAIWAELLAVDEVGVNDNFFDLGGDSISAMRMILKVESLTGSTIPQDYFRGPTVAALVAYCMAEPSATPTQPSSHSVAKEPALEQRSGVIGRLANGQVTTKTLLHRMIYQRLLGLTYVQGVRWLAWLGQPPVAERLFGEERKMFRRLAEELDNPSAATDKAFSISVLSHLIRDNYLRRWSRQRPADGNLMKAMRNAPERFWRTFAQRFEQTAQDKSAPLLQFSGLEHLIHAQKRGQGTILLTYHANASALANAILAEQTNLGKIPTISLVRAEGMANGELDEDEENMENVSAGWAASYALQAQRILQKGGVIRIVNDVSYDAPNSLSKKIGGRQYQLKAGFAELALTTGATILPTYYTFDEAGCVYLTILPALVAPDGDSPTVINSLMDQYVAFLEATWRKAPESLGWGSLQRYNTRPLATTAAATESIAQPVRG